MVNPPEYSEYNLKGFVYILLIIRKYAYAHKYSNAKYNNSFLLLIFI